MVFRKRHRLIGRSDFVAKKKYRAGFYLLYRKEDRHDVWLYERLQNHEVKARIRQGWKIA